MPASRRRSPGPRGPAPGGAVSAAAALALAALAAGGCVLSAHRTGLPARTITTPPQPAPVSAAASGAGGQTTTTTLAVAPAPHPRVPPDGLTLGSSGPEVLTLQQHLSGLGYWLGTPDGVFGDTTQQAVFAYQKAAGVEVDGVVGPMTAAALGEGVVPQPRSTSGQVVEVDLEHDLLLIVQDGKVQEVLNTSTGGGYWYASDGVTALAQTPTGQFQIYRQVDGMVVDSLGQLWRPKFFVGGFAIHGDTYVPAQPVSHGCVRVSNEAIDWIWADDVMPIGTSVLVY